MVGATTGDIVIWARPVAADTFAPFGRLLGPGDRLHLGRRGGVLLAHDEGERGPHRFTHLQRYAHARRLLLPLGSASFVLPVLGAGDAALGPPSAFIAGGGRGILLEPGVWHAGPVALTEGGILEIQETRGRVDVLDRSPLRDLLGVEGIRVRVAEDPEEVEPTLDLDLPGAVLVEENLDVSLTLALLLIDDLDVEPEHPALLGELDRVGAAMCEIAAQSKDLGGLFGVGPIRELWRGLGIDPTRRPAPYEDLVRAVIGRQPNEPADALEGVLRLVALRRQVAIGALDAATLVAPLQLRRGRPGELLVDRWGRPVDVEGTPVLSDRDGPVGGPLGTTSRLRPGPGMLRALVTLYLPPGIEESVALAHLEEASRAARRYCRGVEAGRLVVRVRP